MFGDSGIKFISIIIGVIFLIGLVIVANRFGGRIREKLQLTKVATTTITPTPTVDFSNVGEVSGETTNNNIYSQVSQTPDTGVETLFIPLLISLFGLGLKLRKAS